MGDDLVDGGGDAGSDVGGVPRGNHATTVFGGFALMKITGNWAFAASMSPNEPCARATQ